MCSSACNMHIRPLLCQLQSSKHREPGSLLLYCLVVISPRMHALFDRGGDTRQREGKRKKEE